MTSAYASIPQRRPQLYEVKDDANVPRADAMHEPILADQPLRFRFGHRYCIGSAVVVLAPTLAGLALVWRSKSIVSTRIDVQAAPFQDSFELPRFTEYPDAYCLGDLDRIGPDILGIGVRNCKTRCNGTPHCKVVEMQGGGEDCRLGFQCGKKWPSSSGTYILVAEAFDSQNTPRVSYAEPDDVEQSNRGHAQRSSRHGSYAEPEVQAHRSARHDSYAEPDGEKQPNKVATRPLRDTQNTDQRLRHMDYSSANDIVHHNGNCATIGCVPFTPSNPCQCNTGCSAHSSCCSDYRNVCVGKSTPEYEQPSPATVAQDQATVRDAQKLAFAAAKAKAVAADKASTKDATTPTTTCPPLVGACRDALPGDTCHKDAQWAMQHGVAEHPEWYDGLNQESTLIDFQAHLHKQHKACCPPPCTAVTVIDPAAVALAKAMASGPVAQTFYMYRAQSDAAYPLENLNTADLAGVMWYLHNEVIPATPRKYGIDRIKRYKVTVKNTYEFWNVHHRQFGPFMAFDAGRCSTPICEEMHHAYGFIVGCQMQDLNVAAYTSFHRTTWGCKKGSDECHAPLWFSLPGVCPSHGLHNGEISGNSDHMDVNGAKSGECVAKMPGGHCGQPTGGPDCTYSYEEAGEIFLDELAGIPEYDEFWKGSLVRCENDIAEGRRPRGTVCVHNKEYDGHLDKGIGCNFWNGKHDKSLGSARMNAVRALFKKHHPQWPETLTEPICDFDTFYTDEFTWLVNHTGAPNSAWWNQRMPVENHV